MLAADTEILLAAGFPLLDLLLVQEAAVDGRIALGFRRPLLALPRHHDCVFAVAEGGAGEIVPDLLG